MTPIRAMKNITPGSGENESNRAFTADVHSASLYSELKRIARLRMRGERSDHTLQPTALINELYVRLMRNPNFCWKDRSHFLLAASQAMRHMLVDHAREKRSEKRGGGWTRLEMTEAGGVPAPDSEQILEVDAVLVRLAKKEPRMARVVELRFFAGMTFDEIGEVLSIDPRTAKRDWTLARVWLSDHLGGANSDERGRMGAD
jgi:RNA polymerase sigma-70 factor, ECF subfamily